MSRDEQPLRPGERVMLTRTGRVAFVRSGFALIRWDHGHDSVEWAVELQRDLVGIPRGPRVSEAQ
jgi:hypothetical protein